MTKLRKILHRFKRKVMSCIGFNIEIGVNLNSRNIKQFLYFTNLFSKIKGVDGDIVGCGVFRGDTLKALILLSENEGKNRTVWGFDSFLGFPKPSLKDRSVRNPQEGELKCSLNNIKKLISSMNVGVKVELVKGFFNDTLPKTSLGKIALLHLDVDLYDSYKTTLEHLFPKVSIGGVVMFDEYMNDIEIKKFPGASLAIDEYFNGKGYVINQDKASSKYFLIKDH